MKNAEKEIKKVYADLHLMGVSARITVRTRNNMLLDYPVFGNLILRDMTEDDCLFMEDRVNSVIKIQSSDINKFSALGKDLICTDRKTKSILGGTVTYFWQDDVNAILSRGDGAYCVGKTLRDAVRCCKAIIKICK